MTNPDNVGGLPELPKGDVAFREDCLSKWQYAHSDEQMRAYGELCRAAPAGMVLVPREIVANYRESTHIPRHRRICDSALAAPAGGDDVDTLLALVPRPAMAHHKMDEAEEREIKRVNRFRDRVIENIRAHCASRPVSAPAGSGEVENLASRLVSMSNGLHSAHLCTDLRRAAALLRKLQQGAE